MVLIDSARQPTFRSIPIPAQYEINYHDGDRPDMRHPDFEILAMSLPPQIFKQLMSRDDIICNDEDQVLNLVQNYIQSHPD